MTCKRFTNDEQALMWAEEHGCYIFNRMKSKRGGYLYNFQRKYDLFRDKGGEYENRL